MPYIIACDNIISPAGPYQFSANFRVGKEWTGNPDKAYVYQCLDDIKPGDTCFHCKVIKHDEAILFLMGIDITCYDPEA